MTVKKILVTTDGSVSGDGSKAGYGYIVRDEENNRLIGKARGGTRINDIDQVEAIAVLQAVRYIDKKMSEGVIDKNAEIILLSDSKRNEMIYSEGRIEPIEANLSRWREIRHLTKDWNFKLNWIKSHLEEWHKALLDPEKAKRHHYNEMADSEAKKGKYIEHEKEIIFSPKEGKQMVEGYVDPDPALSSIKTENSFPQKPHHSTVNNSGVTVAKETWHSRNRGSSKSTYLSQFTSMRKAQQAEQQKNESKPETKKDVRHRFTFETTEAPKKEIKENKEEKVQNQNLDFKSKFKLARGRFNKSTSEDPKFKSVEELNQEQGYKGRVYK